MIMALIKDYYRLTKPGIIYGNAITAIAGFLLASKGSVDIERLIAMLIGISLVVASACVFNNYLDRDIDALMARTKNRALVQGRISSASAIIYGAILGLLGIAILILHTNLLAAGIGFFGFIVYIVLYTPLKRTSVYGTIVGAMAGAVPPVAGYCAVTGQIDTAAILLFVIMTLWQMPHFFGIGVYRLKDYAAASIPILPVVYGVRRAKIHVVLYIIAFTMAALSLTYFGYTGYVYLGIMGLLCLTWLALAITGFGAQDDTKWGRRVFLFSLVMILAWSVLISFGRI